MKFRIVFQALALLLLFGMNCMALIGRPRIGIDQLTDLEWKKLVLKKDLLMVKYLLFRAHFVQ